MVKYEFSRNKLNLWYADDDAINEAIKRGALQGKIKDQKGTLTDSTENLLKFLGNTAKCGEFEVFKGFGEFSKN